MTQQAAALARVWTLRKDRADRALAAAMVRVSQAEMVLAQAEAAQRERRSAADGARSALARAPAEAPLRLLPVQARVHEAERARTRVAQCRDALAEARAAADSARRAAMRADVRSAQMAQHQAGLRREAARRDERRAEDEQPEPQRRMP